MEIFFSDHDFIMINLGGNVDAGISFGKSYWKFNDELLQDKNYTSAFEICWNLSQELTVFPYLVGIK